jgi:hypothetical protein
LVLAFSSFMPRNYLSESLTAQVENTKVQRGKVTHFWSHSKSEKWRALPSSHICCKDQSGEYTLPFLIQLDMNADWRARKGAEISGNVSALCFHWSKIYYDPGQATDDI